MKKRKFIILGILVSLIGCSNPNQEYLEKIKNQVKEDALGVEMNYKNISFQWVDTLFVKEKLNLLKTNYKESLNTILDIEYFAQDNFKKGKLFSLKYLTKDRLEELRNWEKNERGIPFNKEFKDYYEFAFANRNASKWTTELCNQIEKTDNLLTRFESLKEGNLELISNTLWYYKRMDDFNSNNSPNAIWERVNNKLIELKKLEKEIDTLSKLNPENVLSYKSLNHYKINNPILNNAEQELKKYFLFDSKFNIIGKEEFRK
ncbi:hypothetical protein [uncultured Polaribacter sp.]|uniref:hypothetical protein n=1 Tax=uncultured Polaribacter sp. TaxID=174711 RepID=UPI00261BC61C|nr:hypothetical protein [uncultured Polaribacter sp.]